MGFEDVAPVDVTQRKETEGGIDLRMKQDKGKTCVCVCF